MIVVDGFPMDLAVSEEHSFPSEVTSYPVEGGGEISDHIRVLPEEITLECIVSDSPIGEVAQHETRQAPAGFFGAIRDVTFRPGRAAYDKLLAIRAARRLVTIETTLDTFVNMALIDLTVPKSKDQDGGLFFTAKFKHVELVTNRRTRVRVATKMATGGKAKKGTLEQMEVFQRFTWNLGDPAGAPLRTSLGKPDFDFCEVIVVKRNRDNASPVDLRFGDPAKASPKMQSVGAGGRILLQHEVVDFKRDLARDQRLKLSGQEQALKNLQNSRSRDPLSDPGTSQNLPAGVDPSRFSAPPPRPTFTPDGPSTTFPVGTVFR